MNNLYKSPRDTSIDLTTFYRAAAAHRASAYDGQLSEAFQSALRGRHAGLTLGDCRFYHTMQFPDGTIQHGDWDLRGRQESYLGDFNFEGKRILEVGPASGFLSFAMEQRGAEVVSFDLPPGATPVLVPADGADHSKTAAIWRGHMESLRNGWWYAHRQYGSGAKAVYGDLLNLPSDLGRFDATVFAALLLHVPDPFGALQQAAAVSDGAIIVTDLMPAWAQGDLPMMAFNPTPPPIGFVHWWALSPAAVAHMLQNLGFSDLAVTCHRQRRGEGAGQAESADPREADFFTVIGRRPVRASRAVPAKVSAAPNEGRRACATPPPKLRPVKSADASLPPPELRFAVAGTDDPISFQELGKKGHGALLDALSAWQVDVTSLGRVLDFGCGVGRVLRYWGPQPPFELHGADFNPAMIAWCSESLPFASFSVNPLEGPLAYESGSFGLVYALSVFTHLPVSLQLSWLRELLRVLRPGGYLYLTVHGDAAAGVLDELLRRQYLAGELVVTGSETPGANNCAAFHPSRYIFEEFAARHGLSMIDFAAEGARGNPPQDAYLLRKDSGRPARAKCANGKVALPAQMNGHHGTRDLHGTPAPILRGVNFIGPVTVASGLGQASRGYLAALDHAGVPAQVVPAIEGFRHQQQVAFHRPPVSSQPFPTSLVQLNADATGLALACFPKEYSERRYRIGLWVWELAALPSAWHSYIQHYDEIWVPSSFCQRAVAAQSNRPVRLMPYVVSRDGPPDRSLRARLQVPDEATVFLYIFDASSYLERKNPRALIEAFIAEFGDDAAAALVIKLSYGDSASTELGAIRAACRARANIRLMEGVMPEGDILRLIDAADCYVSPHRSEGFGLTIAEAMLRAKPVIATGYAGPADYLSEATGFPISFTLSEIQQDIGPYAKGHVWAEPRHDHLRQLMRRVTLNRAEAEARALAGQACIRQRFSAAAVGLAMQSRLDEIWQGQRQVDDAGAERL